MGKKIQTFRRAAEKSGYRPAPGLGSLKLLEIVLEDVGHSPAATERSDLHKRAMQALPCLEPQHKDVLCRSYGLLGEETQTSAEIARQYGERRRAFYFRRKEALNALREKVWGRKLPPESPKDLSERLKHTRHREAVMDFDDRRLGALLTEMGRLAHRNPKELLAGGGLRAIIYQKVYDLPPPYHDVLKLHYGLDGRGQRSMEDVTDLLGKKHAPHVSLLKRAAMDMLRKAVARPAKQNGASREPLRDFRIAAAIHSEAGYRTPEEILLHGERLTHAVAALQKLDRVHRLVLYSRLEEACTLAELGRELCVTRERMRQIKNKANARIRRDVRLKSPSLFNP